MNRTLWLGFLMSLTLPATVNAQSPFDGTWNADLVRRKSRPSLKRTC